MSKYAQRKKENVLLQRLMIIVIFACCMGKIWTTQQKGGELWIDVQFPFLYANEIVYKLITSFLLLVNAWVIVLFLRRISLIRVRNYYPAFLYLLFGFIFPGTLTLWGVIIGFFFIFFMLPALFDLNEENATSRIFSYGLLCGFLSLIYAPFLLLLVFIYITILKERLYNVRLFLFPVVGVLLVYIYLFSGCYLLDSMDMIHEYKMVVQSQICIDHVRLNIFEGRATSFFILFLSMALLGLLAFFNVLRKSIFEVIYKRKKYYLLLLFLLLQSVFTLFFHLPYFLFAQIFLILLAILVCISMLYVKRGLVYWIFFAIVFLIGLIGF
jgi:hypothetical protein